MTNASAGLDGLEITDDKVDFFIKLKSLNELKVNKATLELVK